MNKDMNSSETPDLKNGMLARIWGLLPYLAVVLMAALLAFRGVTCSEKKTRLAAANNRDAASVQEAVNVVALKLKPTTIQDRINLPAVVEPWIKLKIMAEVRGRVIQKKVQEGASVRKGDLIAVIDERDYVNAYNSAKALYETALASFERYTELHKAQLSTKSQLDTARANMENAKASMDNAALSLGRCRIHAPFTGILNHVYFEKDQYVNAGDMMAELIQMDRVKVNVGIPESDVEAVRKLSSFDIIFDALGGRTVKGTKVYLSKTTDSEARLYSLKLAVENPGHDILPDMFARVKIVKHEVTDGVAIPLYAIITNKDTSYVYVVDNDNMVHLRRVETGLQESWQVEVTKGLSLGERVVVVGHRSVGDGDTVNVIRTVDSAEALKG